MKWYAGLVVCVERSFFCYSMQKLVKPCNKKYVCAPLYFIAKQLKFNSISCFLDSFDRYGSNTDETMTNLKIVNPETGEAFGLLKWVFS